MLDISCLVEQLITPCVYSYTGYTHKENSVIM